jgi:hypothetical protein
MSLGNGHCGGGIGGIHEGKGKRKRKREVQFRFGIGGRELGPAKFDHQKDWNANGKEEEGTRVFWRGKIVRKEKGGGKVCVPMEMPGIEPNWRGKGEEKPAEGGKWQKGERKGKNANAFASSLPF